VSAETYIDPDGEERPAEPALDALTAALRSFGRATLPAGFDESVATFDEMMAAVDAMPQEVKDDLADEAARADTSAPHRVVDIHDQGWYLTGDGLYHADYGSSRGLEPLTLDELTAQRGPWRPVEPVTDADEKLIVDALVEAGQKAAGSVLVALYALFRAEAKANPVGPGRLLSGREGSWESAGLRHLAWDVGSQIAEKPSRFHQMTSLRLVDVIERWVTDPERYTEVAETLAYIFGRFADAAGGWDKVADRHLQPGTRWSQNGAAQVYGYLMSTAETLDTGRL